MVTARFRYKYNRNIAIIGCFVHFMCRFDTVHVGHLYERQYERQQQLLEYQRYIEREQEIAAALYEKIILSGFVESPNLKYLHSSMSLFNGDVLLSAMTPSGQHNILLGDFTGHGLSASIGVGPTAEVFYGMTRKGFDVQEIVSEINSKLHRLLPVDMFFGDMDECKYFRFVESPNLKYLHSSMSLFNGDVLLSAMTPSGQHNILLGDFTGHGLSASIGVGPTAEVFYGMTRKGFDVQEIVSEINSKLHRLLPVDMFFAACLISLDGQFGSLSICSGGLPDHYLYNHKKGSLRSIPSFNLPLGIVSSDQLDPNVQHYSVTKNDRFYCLTDGVIETENRHGKQFGSRRLEECLIQTEAIQQSGFENIRDALDGFREGLGQQDDITLVEVSCDRELLVAGKQDSNQSRQDVKPRRWRTAMEFHASTLKEINPVPIVVNALMQIQELQTHREPIFMVISELFANALDHGLLSLDASIKSTENGVAKYFELRDQRLESLEDGMIKVVVSHQPIEGNAGRLVIRVEDSGEGFDYKNKSAIEREGINNSERGVALVRKLCRSVEFQGAGNRVKAVYEWS